MTDVRGSVSPLAAILVLATAQAHGQDAPVRPTGEPSAAWEYSVQAYAFLLPDDEDYVQTAVIADRGRLHLEGRYNYEDLDTGSAWAGFRFSGGEDLAWEIAPIVGGVFGQTDAIAAGYEGYLGWRKLELYSEGEYVLDVDSAGSFFYAWSEASIRPLDWFRVGLVGQRTRTYRAEREIQRGLLVGFSYRSLELTGYLLNPDDYDPIVVLAVLASF